MKTQEIILCKNLLVCLMIVSGCSQSQMDTAVEPGRQGYTEAAVALCVEHVTISAHRVELCYQVRNNSGEDIWFCDDMDAGSPIDFETVASRDGETLFIRMRLGMPAGWWRVHTHPHGRYRRLARGEVHRGVLWLACPVQQQPVLTSRSAHHPHQLKEARFLVLEIGYYCGDLPARLLDISREAAEEHKSFDADLARLAEEIGRLEMELEQLTGTARRAEAAETIERLRRQEDRLRFLSESGRFYLRDYGFDVSESLLEALEDRRSQIDRAANEISVPYLYEREAEGEHLLSATVVDIPISYLPPRIRGTATNGGSLRNTCIRDTISASRCEKALFSRVKCA
jgi:hypothetical protein